MDLNWRSELQVNHINIKYMLERKKEHYIANVFDFAVNFSFFPFDEAPRGSILAKMLFTPAGQIQKLTLSAMLRG